MAKALIGADLDLLEAPALALANSLSALDAVLPDGEDLTRWRTGLTTVATTWSSIETRVAADVDWPSLELDLQAAGRAKRTCSRAVDRLLAGAVAALGVSTSGARGRRRGDVRRCRRSPRCASPRSSTASSPSCAASVTGSSTGSSVPTRSVPSCAVSCNASARRSTTRRSARSPVAVRLQQWVLAMVDSLPLRAVADEIAGTLTRSPRRSTTSTSTACWRR